VPFVSVLVGAVAVKVTMAGKSGEDGECGPRAERTLSGNAGNAI